MSDLISNELISNPLIQNHEEHSIAKKKKRRKRIRHANQTIILILVFIALFAHLTNPYTLPSVVKNPFRLEITSNGISYKKVAQLSAVDIQPFRALGNLKDMWHMIANRFGYRQKEPRLTTLDDIIDQIHYLRFNPDRPYIISGDHFSILYPRSLGIFYHSILDPRTARSSLDWNNRQLIYLKTTLYALEAYKQTNTLSTTIVPIGPLSVTMVNHFNPPSDTLYSILYAIDSMQSTDTLRSLYPYERLDGRSYSLTTQRAAKDILDQYKPVLKRHYDTFTNAVVDSKTGLIKKSIYLSGEKDSVERESAFYDNVVLWKTKQLAQKLDIIPKNDTELETLRSKILTTFWDEKNGTFFEDLSQKSLQLHWYSSDWLIALMTGFLNPASSDDRVYIEKSVAFIQRNNLARPFGLKYQPDEQKSKLFWLLQIAASEYGTHAIWSNLGQEYTKLLTRLYQTTCNEAYLSEAQYQIQQYTENILKYQGFPELYDEHGNMYQIKLYTSVRQTGWVVGFEEAKAMTDYTVKEKAHYCPTN